MASRAIQLRYDVDHLEPNGDVVLEIKAIFFDTADATRTQVFMCSATLDPNLPATWNASIRAAMVAAGVSVGFVDLTAAGCFIPTYTNT